MTHNILLQIDAVRKHLERLEEERQGLTDLIKQLEEARDTMASRLSAMEQKQEEVEKWSNEQQAIISRLEFDGVATRQELSNIQDRLLNNSQEVLALAPELTGHGRNDDGAQLQDSRNVLDQNIHQLQQEFEEKLQSIEKLNSDLAQSVENNVQAKIQGLEAVIAIYKEASIEPAQSLAEKLNNAIAELHKAFNLRAHELDERLERFSATHVESLEQMNKVYQQIYVAFEKLQSSVDAVEVSLESKTQGMQRQSGEIAEIIQAEQENNEARITAITDSLRRMTEDDIGKFQQQLQGRMDELELHDAEFQDLLQSRDHAVQARMQQMWFGIILAAIISLAGFIFSRF